jgi:hypothetical protein
MSEANISASRSSVRPRLDALNVRLRTRVATEPLLPSPVAQAS